MKGKITKKRLTEEEIVILFCKTEHGKKYYRACGVNDIAKSNDTVMVSESFSRNSSQTVEDAYKEAFCEDIEDIEY